VKGVAGLVPLPQKPASRIHGRVEARYPPNDPGALSGAIVDLVESGDAASLGRAGLERVSRQYTWSSYVERIEPVYHAAAEAG